MADILTRGNTMPPAVVAEMFNAVQGRSALARMTDAEPVAFNGSSVFVFSMDKEADIVAENGAKSNGGATATPVIIQPYKFEYGTRVSDEFLRGSEEYNLNVTRSFIDGASRKFARAVDIGAGFGLNPRTMQASTVIGNNNIAYGTTQTGNVVSVEDNDYAAALNGVIGMIANMGYQTTGLALAPEFATGIGAQIVDGVQVAPEYMFGGDPETFHGMRSAVSPTMTGANSGTLAIVGNWDAFRWGYATDVEFEVIEYGDPDNSGSDLKGHNQVYLRCEAYIGWGILDNSAFGTIEK